MQPTQIKKFLESYKSKKEKTIVIIDFGNVEKWKESLDWDIGINQLGQLVKHFASGKKYLRRFYYGEDYGPKESATELLPWSKGMLEKARMSGFQLVTKRVKYIRDTRLIDQDYTAKCDLDVEMTVDLIRERNSYENIVLFSGDGDMAYALKYLKEKYGKECYVFAARGHVGREIIDAKKEEFIKEVLFAEDFEYRLNYRR